MIISYYNELELHTLVEIAQAIKVPSNTDCNAVIRERIMVENIGLKYQ